MNDSDRGYKIEEQLSELFDQSVTAEIVSSSTQGGTSLSVSHIHYVRPRDDSDQSEQSRTVRQTVVLFDAADLDLPKFTLRPRQKGIVGKLFAVLGGTANLKFEDTPEFDQQYVVLGWNETACRTVFTQKLRHHLESTDGWEIQGNGKSLVIARSRRIIPAEEIDTFTTDALAILTLVQEGEAALDAQPEIRRNVTAEDVTATAQKMDGIAGGMMARMLQKEMLKIKVTAGEVKEFLAAESPRNIPNGMKRQVVGDYGPLIIGGILLTIVGIGGAIACALFADGWDRLTGLLFVPAAIGGFCMAYFPWKSEIQKCRCMQYGQKVQGKVVKVIRTDTSINNQRRYQVKVEYDFAGSSKIVRVNAYGDAVDKAKAIQESGEPVVLIVDTKDNSIAVCPDLLTIFE